MHLDQFDVIRDDIHSERVLIGNFFWEIKAMRYNFTNTTFFGSTSVKPHFGDYVKMAEKFVLSNS